MLNKKILFMVMAFFAWFPLQAAEPASPGASSTTAATISPDNTVRFFNRNIVTFNSSHYGVSARDRAHRAAVRLNEQLDLAGPHKVTQKAEADGIMLQINGGTTFWVTPGDASQLTGETVEELAMNSASALERAIAESRESRDLDSIILALGKSTLASVAALMLAWIVSRMLVRLERVISRAVQEHADRLHIAGVKLLHQERGVSLLNKGLAALFRLLMFVLAYKWLSFVLASFPFTRAWGELLDDFLWNLAAGMGLSVANAIPGLFTAIVIFYLTHFFTRSLDNFFNRIRSGQIRVNWLEAEVAEPTRRIAKAVAWLFALAMAYPYLPGSHSDAFKGLSVLVGLMISLGASNLVGQAASGLILIYGRVFRKGEYVRIGEHEGTVTELGMFATRIRTGLGEELTLANSSVLNDTTKNYSRAVKGRGFVLDTTVTIGYDTPWRQVHAMLELAARRTEGVLADPAPLVFQTALSDWYPQYRLVCQAIPSEPRPRALLLSALHGNIQDVFNEHGVQIMSPQYFEDPPTPKVVPQDKWFTAPAIKPSTERETPDD